MHFIVKLLLSETLDKNSYVRCHSFGILGCIMNLIVYVIILLCRCARAAMALVFATWKAASLRTCSTSSGRRKSGHDHSELSAEQY